MQKQTELVIKTSSARNHGSHQWQHRRCHVALMEVEAGTTPKMISERARGVVSIIDRWDACYVGTTNRCQYRVALSKLQDKAIEMTGLAARVV
jgi:hypothetical protein